VNLLVRSLDASEPDSAPPPARGNLDAPEHAMTAPRAPGLPPDESLANVIRALENLQRKDPAVCAAAQFGGTAGNQRAQRTVSFQRVIANRAYTCEWIGKFRFVPAVASQSH